MAGLDSVLALASQGEGAVKDGLVFPFGGRVSHSLRQGTLEKDMCRRGRRL